MSRLSVDDPATGEQAAEVELLEAAAIEKVVATAAVTARDFARTSIRERIDLCEGAIGAFEASAESIATDITRQMGKPITQARGELRTMIDRARYMMSIAERELAPSPLPEKEGFERWIERVPVGVVLDVAAWNYPLLIPVNVVAAAVLAGNAIVLKHSSRTPLCARHFAEAFARAGAPEGLVTGIAAGHATTAAIVARPEIGYVAFTGSVGGGREISRAAAGRFIDVGLELGGKDPAYVRSDADFDFTVANVAEGAFYNADQSCCAVERVYVARSLYGDFVEALAAETGKWQPADPRQPTSTMGPMAQPDAPAKIAAQIDDAVHRGARVVRGGGITTVAGRGRYFEPTVVAEATHEMSVMVDETFGPVAAVAPVDSDEEAVRLMNDSPYGLTASVWTRDVAAARAIAERIEAGTVFLNRCDYLDPALPWSGWKDSGVGITLSRFGFDRMVKTRACHFRLPART